MNSVISDDLAALSADSLFANGLGRLAGGTVVIAGGGGLIARYTAFALAAVARRQQQRLRIVSLVRDHAAATANYAGYFDGVELELRHQVLGEPLAYDGPAELIFHAGGGSSPQQYRTDPVGVAAANAAAAFDLLELARRRSCPMAYFSSREVYGKAAPGADGRLSEQVLGSFDHLDPRNAYPESKRMTEALMSAYQAQFGVEYHALRLASVYGPGMKLRADGRAMADLISARLDGADLVLNSDGRAVRGYCYVGDAVRAILAIVLNGAPSGAYNIANETEPVTIAELADLLASLPLSGRPNVQVVRGQPAPAGAYSDFGYVPVSTAKLEALGWRPEIGLKVGLQRTLEAFSER